MPTHPPVTNIPQDDPWAKIMQTDLSGAQAELIRQYALKIERLRYRVYDMAKRYHDIKEHDSEAFTNCDNEICRRNAQELKDTDHA